MEEQVEIKLANHEQELEKITGVLNRIEKEWKWYKDTARSLTDDQKYAMCYIVNHALDVIGVLSITRFDARTKLEELYDLKYKHSPELGKTLYLEHYESLHKPYDKLKVKCFNLLAKINPAVYKEMEDDELGENS